MKTVRRLFFNSPKQTRIAPLENRGKLSRIMQPLTTAAYLVLTSTSWKHSLCVLLNATLCVFLPTSNMAAKPQSPLPPDRSGCQGLSRPLAWHLANYFHAFTSICLVSILFIKLQKFPQIMCQSLKGKDWAYFVGVFNFTKYCTIPKVNI